MVNISHVRTIEQPRARTVLSHKDLEKEYERERARNTHVQYACVYRQIFALIEPVLRQSSSLKDTFLYDQKKDG